MKKILFIGTAVAIAMGFASCQKENVTEKQASERLIKETFSACFEQTATKTTISDDAATVNWSADDKIYYFSKDGGAVRSFTIPAAGASASLTLEREDGDTYYNLVYAGNTEPTFTTKTGTSMVFEGVKSVQDGTFRNANISVGHTTPDGSGITFKPVTALVKFTTSRTDIKTIVLTGGNGEKVAGGISVDPTEASPKAELNGDGSTSITVTIGTPAAGTYYINVLPGTYTNGLKLTLKNTSGAEIGTVTASKSTDLSAGNSMINYGDIDGHISDVLLSGKFTVNSTGKQVQFTRGNLYWDGSAWKLEAGQSDYQTTRSDTHVGHLYWSNLTDYQLGNESYKPYCSESYSFSSQSTSDKFFCGEFSPLTIDGTSDLFALSQKEWNYLLNTRTDDNRFAKAKVNGKTGIVIFPDNYTSVPGSTGIASVNDKTAAFPTSSIEEATWSSMESAGCVFLPAAGYWENSAVNYPGVWGCYWSSTPNSNAAQAYSLNIGGSQINPENNGKRLSGLTVRLVKVCTPPTYTEGSYTGNGIMVAGIWWAPVNCGYDAANYKYGKLYQWGRKYGQGYNDDYDVDGDYPGKSTTQTIEVISSALTSHPDGSTYNGKFYYVQPNWYGGADKDALWGETKTNYDPCPAGWRVPTVNELGNLCYTDWNSSTHTGSTERGSWNGTNKGWNFDSVFLPAAGYRYSGSALALDRGDKGRYWSSSPMTGVPEYSGRLLFSSKGQSSLDSNSRPSGLSVRCVQE